MALTPKQIVAANIRFIRKQKGLTQAQAAARIGWTQQAWGPYESGEISMGIEVLSDIARALDTTMSELVSVEKVHSQPFPKVRTVRQGKKQAAPS